MCGTIQNSKSNNTSITFNLNNAMKAITTIVRKNTSHTIETSILPKNLHPQNTMQIYIYFGIQTRNKSFFL